MPWIWRIGLRTSDTKEEWRWDRRWWKCDEGDENWFLCVRARVTDVLTKDDLCLKHCLVPITAADNLSFTHNTVTHVHSHEQTHMCTFPISHITASDPLIGSPWLAVLLINGIHGTLHRAQERLDLIGWLLQQETGNKLLHVGSPLIHLERKKKGSTACVIYNLSCSVKRCNIKMSVKSMFSSPFIMSFTHHSAALQPSCPLLSWRDFPAQILFCSFLAFI